MHCTCIKLPLATTKKKNRPKLEKKNLLRNRKISYMYIQISYKKIDYFKDFFLYHLKFTFILKLSLECHKKDNHKMFTIYIFLW